VTGAGWSCAPPEAPSSPRRSAAPPRLLAHFPGAEHAGAVQRGERGGEDRRVGGQTGPPGESDGDPDGRRHGGGVGGDPVEAGDEGRLAAGQVGVEDAHGVHGGVRGGDPAGQRYAPLRTAA